MLVRCTIKETVRGRCPCRRGAAGKGYVPATRVVDGGYGFGQKGSHSPFRPRKSLHFHVALETKWAGY